MAKANQHPSLARITSRDREFIICVIEDMLGYVNEIARESRSSVEAEMTRRLYQSIKRKVAVGSQDFTSEDAETLARLLQLFADQCENLPNGLPTALADHLTRLILNFSRVSVLH